MTQFRKFYDHSVSRDPLSKSKNREIYEIMAETLLNRESKCDRTLVLASFYEIKIAARPVDTIQDILRSLSLAQTLLKDRLRCLSLV